MSTATLERPIAKARATATGFQVYHPLYGEIDVPGGIETLDHFRKWIHSGVLDEKLNVHFFNGIIRVDTEMEEINTHNRVKTALAVCLTPMLDESGKGFYVGDNMLLTNDAAELATEPDSMVIMDETMKSGRIRLTSGETTDSEGTEFVGTPDLIVEIISPSSVKKDRERLMQSYHAAGIPEYWLIDARGKSIEFEIYLHNPIGYQMKEPDGDWVSSRVLGKDFRLTRKMSAHGIATYKLESR